jgi:hypothetical protein
MSPGQLSNLIKSEEIAFRVQFEGDMPPYGLLYFRGPVLSEFDGRVWRMPELSVTGQLRYSRRERPVHYAVTLEPHQKNWLFAIDVPAEVPQVQTRASILYDLQLRNLFPVAQRMRYEMTSWLDYRYGESTSPVILRNALRLDPRNNPRTVGPRPGILEGEPQRARLHRAHDAALLAELHVHARAPEARHPGIRTTISSSTPKLGFCEHFAGAFTLLMRAGGTAGAGGDRATRGGEVNPLNKRAHRAPGRTAHAWSEGLDSRRRLGYASIPRRPVSPTRVENARERRARDRSA